MRYIHIYVVSVAVGLRPLMEVLLVVGWYSWRVVVDSLGRWSVFVITEYPPTVFKFGIQMASMFLL